MGNTSLLTTPQNTGLLNSKPLCTSVLTSHTCLLCNNAVHVSVVEEEVALGRHSLPALRSSPVSIIPPKLHTRSHSSENYSYQNDRRAKLETLQTKQYYFEYRAALGTQMTRFFLFCFLTHGIRLPIRYSDPTENSSVKF
jgi:hypothetical protein